MDLVLLRKKTNQNYYQQRAKKTAGFNEYSELVCDISQWPYDSEQYDGNCVKMQVQSSIARRVLKLTDSTAIVILYP